MFKAFNSTLLGLIIIISVSYSQPSWKLLPNSPTAGGRFDDLSFININTGWISSDKVYKTTDGGLNWVVLAGPFPGGAIRSIAFLDSLLGFFGMLDSGAPLRKTTDGGITWSIVGNIPFPQPRGICGMSVVNSNTIYACGRYSDDAVVIKSTDAGNSWQSINMNSYASSLIDCKFFTADSGFVAGGLGATYMTRKAVILFTSNGGNNWAQRVISNDDSCWCWKISFPNRNTGYVSIEKGYAGSQPIHSFFKTTNGGVNWVQMAFTNHEQGIGFVNENLGWLGYSNMMQTTNGGLNWSQVNFFATGMINRMRFFGDTIGYASGRRIYKYTTEPIGIAINQNSTPSGYSLHQNYPNPFNPATTIKYEIFEYSMTTITIYSSIGEKVFVYADGSRAPSIRSFVWDGTDMNGNVLPSGVYFYKLETEKHTESKKMMLIR